MARPPRLARRAAGALALAAAAVLALAPAPAAAGVPPLRGAATHPLWADSSIADFDRELDLLAEAGANVVRIDLGWATLEQDGKGSLSDWYVAKADTFFEHARARGLGVIVTFWATPCWASSAPPEVKQDCGGNWWERQVHVYPPNDAADFADAAAWVAGRWGDRMTALEIWNEPNYQAFFRTTDPVGDYAALLRSAYPRIKQADPDLTVIGPAMVASDAPFLEALYGEGVGPYLDGISSRPFNQGRDPYDAAVPAGGIGNSFLLGVPLVRDAMIAHGDAAKKLWFTELGWSSCAPGGTSTWCVTAEQQAQYVADAFRIIRDRWDYVDAVSVYNLRNKGVSPTDRETQMGLLQRDFSPKPSWWSFRSVLAELAAAAVPQPVAAPAAPPARALGSPALADTVAPALRRLSLAPRSFRPARGRAGGAAVTFSLSEPARVTFRVERARSGRRERGAWARLRGRLDRAGRAGVNRVRFEGRVGRRVLAAGRYRLVATARDAAGNRSAPARAPFRIER
jgi:hypothetical protein